MSREYKTTKRTIEDERLIKTTCDICGAIAKYGEWSSSVWEVNETEIKITIHKKDGEAYPEFGDGCETTIDICPECFKNKLIPWLQSQGADIEEKEWGY